MLDNNTTELTEEAVLNIIDQLGLKQVDKWFDGNQSRIVYDCDKGDGTIVCVWVEPPYEAKVWIKNANPRNNGLVEDITTTEALADAISNIKPSDTGLLESVRPATENEKYFLYKVDQLKNEKNATKLEAVVKAFGLIRKVDTKLSDKEKEQFAYFESLEKARGNQPKKAFIESLTNEAMKRVNKEQFSEVRNAINAYRTWILGKTHACMESMSDSIDNYNSMVRELKQEGATITDVESFANKLTEHGIQATVKNDTVTVQRPDGTFDDYKPWGQFTNGTPRWVKLWSDDYGRMNYLDPSALLVDVFMSAHKLPDVSSKIPTLESYYKMNADPMTTDEFMTEVNQLVNDGYQMVNVSPENKTVTFKTKNGRFNVTFEVLYDQSYRLPRSNGYRITVDNSALNDAIRRDGMSTYIDDEPFTQCVTDMLNAIEDIGNQLD